MASTNMTTTMKNFSSPCAYMSKYVILSQVILHAKYAKIYGNVLYQEHRERGYNMRTINVMNRFDYLRL